MKKLFYCCCLILLSISLLLTGCGNNTTEPQKPDGTFKIVTSFYPIYIATINIAKDVEGVEVVNMTKPQTGCLHDYQISTDDMKTLEDADIFVANGAGMEEFLDKIVKEHKNLAIIDASKGISLLEDDGKPNPHVWLNINNAIRQVENISKQLSEADPVHADAYKANAASYIGRLKELQLELHNELSTLSHRDIVTFHEAFPYFAQEFDLNIVEVIESEPGTEPAPKELEDIIEDIRQFPVKVLFTEPQYSPSAAETISRETGAMIYSLDPVVTGEANPQAADAYISTMRHNAQVLKEALQ